MIKISGTYLYPYPSEQTEKRERTAINFTYSCPYKYFLYESKSGDRIGNKYYSTKAEAEVALSEYLNSLSPEEFANHIAERMLAHENHSWGVETRWRLPFLYETCGS